MQIRPIHLSSAHTALLQELLTAHKTRINTIEAKLTIGDATRLTEDELNFLRDEIIGSALMGEFDADKEYEPTKRGFVLESLIDELGKGLGL